MVWAASGFGLIWLLIQSYLNGLWIAEVVSGDRPPVSAVLVLFFGLFVLVPCLAMPGCVIGMAAVVRTKGEEHHPVAWWLARLGLWLCLTGPIEFTVLMALALFAR